MQIQIDPDTQFTTGQVDRMLNLNTGRTKLLCDKGLVPYEVANDFSKTGTSSRYKVKYKDLDKVMEAHKNTRSLSRKDPQLVVRRSEWNDLVERLEFLENAFDHYTAPDLEQPAETR